MQGESSCSRGSERAHDFEDGIDGATEACVERRTILFTPRAQAVSALIIFGVSAWLTAATFTAIGSRHVLADQAQQIKALETAYASLRSRSQLASRALTKQVAALERLAQERLSTIRRLGRAQRNLARELKARSQELAALAREHDRAQDHAAMLEGSAAAASRRLTRALEEKQVLEQALREARAMVEEKRARLRAGLPESDAGRPQDGRFQLIADAATPPLTITTADQSAHPWFEDWLAWSVESLQELVVGTGVDVETLVARVEADESGQGGPFEGIEDAAPGDEAGSADAADAIAEQIRRLSALQKLANALPFAAPLDDFELTSRFGKRRDPFSRRWAFHSGLDFGAPAGSEILATAPGRVITAGRAGPYGILVEIDHGMGVITRYGHLQSTSVQAGEDVALRQPVGVIGNTGRSTGRHLHYEIRIDDQAYNPAKFLDAGRYLSGVFTLRPGTGMGGKES